ncbi:MAG: sigma-70 family RNA polymerase sigma factor [Myxococcales bacterium]|nr:sigma-70 family RNA polymerase sigma factor [Myxococcales bacterium]
MEIANLEEQPTFSDDELVQRVKQGEDLAFSLLVRRYQHRVFNLVHRILGVPEETEDLAQEVFVTLHRSLEQFRGDCAFSTWLYRITVNLCKNRLKYLHRRNFHRAQEISETSETDIQAHVSMALANPEQQLLGRELETLLQRELLELEEEFRIILVLRDIEHLPYEHISEITGLALGTVKSRLHRARSALRQRMQPYLSAGT